MSRAATQFACFTGTKVQKLTQLRSLAPREKVDVAFKYLGHTNGGPSAAFARTLGSHGTRAVDSQVLSILALLVQK